jgi:hypothetical protein
MDNDKSMCKSCGEIKTKLFLKLSRCSKIYCDERGKRWAGLVCPPCARRLCTESARRANRRKAREAEKLAEAQNKPFRHTREKLGSKTPEFVAYRPCSRCGDQMSDRYYLCVNCRPYLPAEDRIWESA